MPVSKIGGRRPCLAGHSTRCTQKCGCLERAKLCPKLALLAVPYETTLFVLNYFRFRNLVDHYCRIFPDLEVDVEEELAKYKVSPWHDLTLTLTPAVLCVWPCPFVGFIDRLVRFPYPSEVIKKEIAGHVCCVCFLVFCFLHTSCWMCAWSKHTSCWCCNSIRSLTLSMFIYY